MKNLAGVARGTSAQHCTNRAGGGNPNALTVKTWNSADSIGIVIQQQQAGNVDALGFTLPSNFTPTPTITVNENRGFRNVVGADFEQNLNDQICWTGLGLRNNDSEDERCGSMNLIVAGPPGKPLLCVERRTHGGDSGGPVYSFAANGNVWAAGTMVKRLDFGSDWWACYAYIDNVLTDLDYQILLAK